MGTPERFGGNDKSESSAEEQEQLRQLEATAEAARKAGVWDPSDEEDK